jgi:hypothetical protein
VKIEKSEALVKPEIRSTKFETISNDQNTNDQNKITMASAWLCLDSEHWDFGIVSARPTRPKENTAQAQLRPLDYIPIGEA